MTSHLLLRRLYEYYRCKACKKTLAVGKNAKCKFKFIKISLAGLI